MSSTVRAAPDLWIQALPTSQEVDSAADLMALASEITAPLAASLAIVLAAFVQHRNETITCWIRPADAMLVDVPRGEDPMCVTGAPLSAQIEAAAKAIYAAENNCRAVVDSPTHPLAWSLLKDSCQERYRGLAREVAPLLQADMLHASMPEREQIHSRLDHRSIGDVSLAVISAVIAEFVTLRNRRRQMEPRRLRVLAVLRDRLPGEGGQPIAEELADKICQALDAEGR